MRKSSSVLAVAGLLAIGAAGCGGSDSGGSSSSGGSGGGAKIALLLPESKTARYESQDRPRFEKRVKETCPKCEVVYANADQDAAKQQEQANSALTQGVKVMVLDAVDVKAAASIAQTAKAKGVKVISYGRLVSGAPLDYFVSIDPYAVGKQQAEALLAAQKQQGNDKPRVVMINGSPTDSNAAPYKRGAEDVFKAAGADIVQSFDTPDWSPDKASSEMQQAATALGKDGFDAVYAANDGMAGGVIAALKGQGIDPKPLTITGQDAEVTGLQNIVAGNLLMTVYQPIPELAKVSADLAVALAQGKTPPDVAKDEVDNGSDAKVKSVLLPTIAIDTEKIKSVIFRDGFATPDQVCTKAYKAACQKAGLLQ